MDEMFQNRIRQGRQAIDRLDQDLLKLLSRRLQVVLDLAEVKSRMAQPMLDPEREAVLLAQREVDSKALGLPDGLARDVFLAIVKACRNAGERHMKAMSGKGPE